MSGRGERVGVLGGTFDPPHNGHLAAAAGARHALGLDRVLLVVANRPWQKVDDRTVSSAADRLALVEALVAGSAGLEASDLEIRRGGDSFTVDTLEELATADPTGHRFLVVGADAAAGLDTWERHRDLPALATLVVVNRPGAPDGSSPVPADLAHWTTEQVTIPGLDISSTDLRARVHDGRPLDGLTPPAVGSLIDQLRLYRGRP